MKFDDLIIKYKKNLVNEAVPAMAGTAGVAPVAPTAAGTATTGATASTGLPTIKTLDDLNKIADPKQQKAVTDVLSKALKIQGTTPEQKAWALTTTLAKTNPADVVKLYNAAIQPAQATTPQQTPATSPTAATPAATVGQPAAR